MSIKQQYIILYAQDGKTARGFVKLTYRDNEAVLQAQATLQNDDKAEIMLDDGKQIMRLPLQVQQGLHMAAGRAKFDDARIVAALCDGKGMLALGESKAPKADWRACEMRYLKMTNAARDKGSAQEEIGQQKHDPKRMDEKPRNSQAPSMPRGKIRNGMSMPADDIPPAEPVCTETAAMKKPPGTKVPFAPTGDNMDELFIPANDMPLMKPVSAQVNSMAQAQGEAVPFAPAWKDEADKPALKEQQTGKAENAQIQPGILPRESAWELTAKQPGPEGDAMDEAKITTQFEMPVQQTCPAPDSEPYINTYEYSRLWSFLHQRQPVPQDVTAQRQADFDFVPMLQTDLPVEEDMPTGHTADVRQMPAQIIQQPEPAKVQPARSGDVQEQKVTLSVMGPYAQLWKWRRITCRDRGYSYLMGEAEQDGKVIAVAVAVPGDYAPSPPANLYGFSVYREGYWLLAQDAVTGERIPI